MTNRRSFLKKTPLFFSALPVFSDVVNASQKDRERASSYHDPGQRLIRDGLKHAKRHAKGNISPVLREEIMDNPDAVFILKTDLSLTKDTDGKFPSSNEAFRHAGYRTCDLMFSKGSGQGGATYIKPNFVGGFNSDSRSVNNGVSTHPSFVAGYIEKLKELGNTNIVVGANGAAKHTHFVESGICEMMDDLDVCFTEGKYESYDDYSRSDVKWIDYDDGVVMKRVPFFSLACHKDTLLINMAKDRIHQLGFTTLSIKNLQGIMPVGYMHICGGWPSTLNRGSAKKVFNPDYRHEIEKRYIRHARMNFKYWDEGGHSRDYFKAGGWSAYKNGEFKPDYKVFWGEQWGQRMMDVNSCIKPHINMVEGIVGIDGAGTLHLNNFITISRNRVSCDSLASWLMGQDPRELPYLRIANERGLGNNDIESLKIYRISEKGINVVNDYRTLERSRMGVHVYTTKGAPLRFF